MYIKMCTIDMKKQIPDWLPAANLNLAARSSGGHIDHDREESPTEASGGLGLYARGPLHDTRIEESDCCCHQRAWLCARRQSLRHVAGFKHPILLLEGSQWKSREDVLQADGATIRSERDLFRYMAAEIMAGVKFLESLDQARTVI